MRSLDPTGQVGEVQMVNVKQGARERQEKYHKGKGGTGVVAKPKKR